MTQNPLSAALVRYATRTLRPCDAGGTPEEGRRIDPGDRCTVAPIRPNGLYRVTYLVSRGTRTACLPTLDGLAASYFQRDYPDTPYPAPGYERATVRSGGCGPTAAAIVVETLRPGQTFGPKAAAALALETGARVSGGTDMAAFSRTLAARFSLKVRKSASLTELRAVLAAGGVAIANAAGRGMFSTGGHFLAVLAEEDGRLVLADPGYYGGKYGARFPRRAAAVEVLSAGRLLRCAPAVLDADCVGRAVRYYLFSR